jgi:hypothetical protein
MVEREIVSYRPVTETRVERKAVTVRRPVIETSTVNQTYSVL